MNPYIRNRRGSYADAQTLPSSIPFARNIINEKFKMVNKLSQAEEFGHSKHLLQYEESSPPPKRTKRKAKPDQPLKQDPKSEMLKVILKEISSCVQIWNTSIPF